MTVQAPDPPPPAAYVSFSGEINVGTTELLLATMANVANQGIPEVHLLISTPGGSVMNGINIYNVLRGLPLKLVTHNVANVDSIGNAIFLAGEERYACANTRRSCFTAWHSAAKISSSTPRRRRSAWTA